MSDMLEQAIIDAEALKEAAAKNAETLVLEKYSGEIKKAVETLLEQEEDLGLGLGAEGGAPAAAPKKTESSIMENIPLAVMEADEDKEIEIPLDGLLKEISNLSESLGFTGNVIIEDEGLQEEELYELGGPMMGEEEEDYSEGLADPLMDEDYVDEGIDPLEEILAELDEMSEMVPETMDENALEEMYSTQSSVYPHGRGDFAAAGGVQAVEEDLQEALEVDIRPVPGRLAMSESEFQLAEEELLALEQDSKIREENEAMRSAVAELKAVNESILGQNNEFASTIKKSTVYINKLRNALSKLDEKLDKANLDNAKLIYQNKALTSDSLNERQKHKLAEAVTNAETIEEARIIFETLQNTVGSTSRKSQPNSLSEAVQKSSSMILSARENKSGGQKSDPTLSRWKFLAGIDKN